RRRVEVSDDGVVLDALAHGVILAASARDARTSANRGTVPLRLLDPGQDPGRGEGVADIGVHGGAREDDADDLSTGSEERASGVSREDARIEGIDAALHRAVVVDVLADGRDLFVDTGRPDAQAPVFGVAQQRGLRAP